VSKASSPMGLKRICTSCGTRFYDLNKRPIICPNCATEFTGDVKLKSRRGRLPADAKKDEPQKAAIAAHEEDEILVEDEEIDVVSLEDVEEDVDDEEDDAAIKLPEDDLTDLDDFEDDDLDDDLEEDVVEDEAE
jgi:uncharacterized protein (TIGR02300 family)